MGGDCVERRRSVVVVEKALSATSVPRHTLPTSLPLLQMPIADVTRPEEVGVGWGGRLHGSLV
jgi:hypothetical protein